MVTEIYLRDEEDLNWGSLSGTREREYNERWLEAALATLGDYLGGGRGGHSRRW